jgi:GTPase SAR1 family protein
VAWPVIVVGGAAITSVIVWRRLRRRKYRLAVLGAQYVGKTTLINSWRGEWIADEADPGRTSAMKLYSKTKLTSEGLRLTFTKLGDVGGGIDSWPQWKDRAKESRYVLYLVDARALAGYLDHQKGRNWYRLADDAGLISGWFQDSRVELCLMVITHTDEDARLAELGDGPYRDLVMTQLDPLILKLGGPRTVRVVVGSLKRLKDAEAVTTQIMREIISWEKSK